MIIKLKAPKIGVKQVLSSILFNGEYAKERCRVLEWLIDKYKRANSVIIKKLQAHVENCKESFGYKRDFQFALGDYYRHCGKGSNKRKYFNCFIFIIYIFICFFF